MNQVAFFLRNKLKINRFRDVILESLNLNDIDNALLCSGFFQEDDSYSVSCKQFSNIQRCCKPLQLKTIGYYGMGKKAYTSFAKGIKTHCCNTCIQHRAMRLRGDKWHAKVFIGKKEKNHLLL